jgi:hypothetical protein
VLGLVLGVLAAPARGDFIPIPLPDPAYLAATAKIPISGPDFEGVRRLSDSVLSVAFSQVLEVRTVPESWVFWNTPPAVENPTPRVLATDLDVTSLSLTFDRSLRLFGVEVEPDNLSTFPITGTFYHGPTVVGSIVLSVNGDGGARLFAGETTSAFTRVDLTAPVEAGGFAIAEIRYGIIPEPSSSVLLAFGLAVLGARLWWRAKDLGGAPSSRSAAH